MFKSIYSQKGKNLNIKKCVVWNNFPITMPKQIVNDLFKQSKRSYSKKYIKSITSMYFSIMAQKLREANLNTSFDMKSLGYLTMEIKPKVCKLTFPPTVKMDAKRMKFRFKVVFKRLCWKAFNQEKIEEIIIHIKNKKRARIACIRLNKMRLSGIYHIGDGKRN